MTGPEHYKRAEALLAGAASYGNAEWDDPAAKEMRQTAQVHATLALAAATALYPQGAGASWGYGEWVEAAGGDGGE